MYPSVTSDTPVTLTIYGEKMTFSIVHISDLHFKIDHPCVERIQTLREDILRQIQGKKAYLVFTGDLVNAGDDDLYEALLDQFFVHLDDIFEAIYMVPGNHDVQRIQTDREQNEGFAADSTQHYLYDDQSNLKLENPFKSTDPLQNYSGLEELLSSHQIRNFFGTLDTNSDFSFVGLNSSWLCCARENGHTDLGKLKIDPAVVEYFAAKLPENGLRVCAFHHPLEWIDEETRQHVQNLITKNFDLVLFGHVHNPSSLSGKFNGDQCLFLQAPAVKSNYSFGANAYTIINIDGEAKRYEAIYRTFSDPQKQFVIGEELTEGGVRYPSDDDENHWKQLKTHTKSGLLSRFMEEQDQIDFSDWYNTHILAKNKLKGEFVEPKVTRFDYRDGQQIETLAKNLSESLEINTPIQFVIGPQDSGLTTASFLTFKSICENFDKSSRVPVYVNLQDTRINRASLISAAVNSSPVRYSNAEMDRLIEQGGVTFIFDQICLPQTQKFNQLVRTLERYFPNTNSVVFCAMDGRFTNPGDTSELQLSPLTDTVFELQPLDVTGIHDLIRKQRVDIEPRELDAMLDNVIASFKQMDEPLYPSSVALLIETLQQLPEFKPLNRVRLLDRYVECILGRFDLEDVAEGTFNSNDKLSFLAYFAGQLATNSIVRMPIDAWEDFCQKYENDKLLELPSNLLKEFTEKGILIPQGDTVTFRADYLFSYFVAKEMHQNESVFERIADDEAFYANHRELVFYGELEGVNNKKLLDATHLRLSVLEEEILETYSCNGIDFDTEWRNLLDEEQLVSDDKLVETISEIQNEEPNDEAIARARASDLNGVDRGRGVFNRHTIKELELRWFVSIKTYLQLVKHSTNLPGSGKLRHLNKALDSAELFIKSLAAKRGIISAQPVCFHSGILYINPLAEVDPEKAKEEFKYAAPASFAKIIGELLTNPQLSPAIRRLLDSDSEIVRYLVRHLLLEAPGSENARHFVNDLTTSNEMVLQTCSLRRLKNKYLGYSIDDEHRRYYSGIVENISEDDALKSRLHHHQLKKQRMLADMKKNLSGGD